MFDPPTVGHDVLEVRPHAPTYLAQLPPARLSVPLTLVLLVGTALRMDSLVGAVLAVGGTVLAVGAVLGLIALHFRTTSIRSSPGRIELRGPLVRDRDIDTATASALLAPVPQPNAGPALMLMVRPARGRSLCVNGTYWNADDLLEIARRVDATVMHELCTPAQVQQMLPGALPLMYRRTWLWACAIVVGGILAISVALVVAVLVFS